MAERIPEQLASWRCGRFFPQISEVASEAMASRYKRMLEDVQRALSFNTQRSVTELQELLFQYRGDPAVIFLAIGQASGVKAVSYRNRSRICITLEDKPQPRVLGRHFEAFELGYYTRNRGRRRIGGLSNCERCTLRVDGSPVVFRKKRPFHLVLAEYGEDYVSAADGYGVITRRGLRFAPLSYLYIDGNTHLIEGNKRALVNILDGIRSQRE